MIPNPLHELTKEELEAIAKESNVTVEVVDVVADWAAAMDSEKRRAFVETLRAILQGAQEMGVTADAYVEMHLRRPA
jgi:hypothetical protein